MRLDKWKEIKEMVLKQFEVEYQGVEDYCTKDGEIIHKATEIIEFEGPMGFMRLEFTTAPRIMDQHAQFGRSSKSGESVDRSADSVVHIFHVYQWNEDADDWEEVKSDLFE